YARTAMPQNSTGTNATHAFAAGRHVAAFGTWLMIEDDLARVRHYLGEFETDPRSGTISPDGKHTAWMAQDGTRTADSVDEPDPAGHKVEVPNAFSWMWAKFVDDAHLIVMDGFGTVRVVDWKNDKVLATLDSGGSPVQLEVDPSSRLVRVFRSPADTEV